MSAWPSVVASTVSTLTALKASVSGWADGEVYDGPPVTQDAPLSFVTVGFVLGEDFAGSFEPVTTLGDVDEEVGSLRSEIVCASGDTDLATVRARAFAFFDGWKAAVKADRTLGGAVTSSALSVDVEPVNTGGAVQRLAVTLTYTALSV